MLSRAAETAQVPAVNGDALHTDGRSDDTAKTERRKDRSPAAAPSEKRLRSLEPAAISDTLIDGQQAPADKTSEKQAEPEEITTQPEEETPAPAQPEAPTATGFDVDVSLSHNAVDSALLCGVPDKLVLRSTVVELMDVPIEAEATSHEARVRLKLLSVSATTSLAAHNESVVR